jgi:putative transposase
MASKEAYMGWERMLPMEQRVHFLSDYLRKLMSFTDLCLRYKISRKTGYKWIHRYETSGIEGYHELSRKPLNSPYRIPFRIQQAIIEFRKRFNWGPKKLLSKLKQRHPEWELPARSTVHGVLKREGLTHKHKRRRHVIGTPQPFAPADRPNTLWTADFKGQFRTKDGIYCYPLTVVDSYSRYLLLCQCLKGPRLKPTKEFFTKVFNKYGLPERIRTDNGVPFASTAAGGLTQLSIWWIRLGIIPERITPGKPQQNGRHERMHRTLKEESIDSVAATHNTQQIRFDVFREDYNTNRPHEGLNFKTPASLYTSSERKMPLSLPPITYPGHYHLRPVNCNGCFSWNHLYVYVGANLFQEYVGLEQLNEDVYDVYFGPIKLGLFDGRNKKNRDYIKLNQPLKV